MAEDDKFKPGTFGCHEAALADLYQAIGAKHL